MKKNVLGHGASREPWTHQNSHASAFNPTPLSCLLGTGFDVPAQPRPNDTVLPCRKVPRNGFMYGVHRTLASVFIPFACSFSGVASVFETCFALTSQRRRFSETIWRMGPIGSPTLWTHREKKFRSQILLTGPVRGPGPGRDESGGPRRRPSAKIIICRSSSRLRDGREGP